MIDADTPNEIIIRDKSKDDSHRCCMTKQFCDKPAHFEVWVSNADGDTLEPEMFCDTHLCNMLYEIIRVTEEDAGWGTR